MSIGRRVRRLAWQSGCTALTIGAACVMAGGAQSALADVGGRAAANLPAPNAQAAGSWGYNPEGQLGIGIVEGYKNPAAVHPLYGQVTGLGSGVVQVSAGDEHGLALRSDGTVWAWGRGTQGQLGDGTLSTSGTPVQVFGLTGVVAVSAGIDDSLALKSDGTVWAWGADQFGELGNGTTSDTQPTPVQVRGLTGITKIAAGGHFAVALRSDGTVWAWGYNQNGQLGNGKQVNSTVPRQVTGLTNVTSIAAGVHCSLAIRSGAYGQSTAWAWGSDSCGLLVNDPSNPHLTPTQVTGIDALSVAGVTVGGSFALVLGSDGSVWGWGDDTDGELGNGPHPGTMTRPVRTFGPGSGITQLSAGGLHVLALKSNGTVLAWGSNDTGALGDGDRVLPAGPVQVTGMTTAVQVSAGWQFSLAVYGNVVVTKGPGI